MDEPKETPAKKFRRLLASSLLFMKLPKKKTTSAVEQPQPKKEEAKDTPKPVGDKKVENVVPAPITGSVSTPKAAPVSKSSRRFFGPTLWNITSVISLVTNVVLVLVLSVLIIRLNSLELNMSYILDLGPSLLGGLFGNFEKMDRAHITTNVEVNTTIPVQFDLALNQDTTVILSQDVTITNALVTVNTGGLNISRANTTIVLPQGTNLPITLNLTVPVNTTVPVTLNVPVDIPLSETQLHEPFAGLQEVVRPLYCLVDSNAVDLNGNPICK